MTSIFDMHVSDLSEKFLSHPALASQALASEILKCALDCANEGGHMIREAISKRSSSASVFADTKVSAADLVTETDVAVEKAIRSRIEKLFPDHMFVGEESSVECTNDSDRTGRYVWIVDPIDGTTNFVHAFPVVAVSIGVAYGEETILGVVYNPLADELWFAWKGCGAFMKRRDGSIVRIHTSQCKELTSAIVSTGFGVPLFRRKTDKTEAQATMLSIVEHNTRVLMTKSRDIRRVGSAACDLCLVATGLTDCYFV
jgi:fructose-1,6-bisphosphatase/inositol monophosphatase family enzyme